MNRWKRQVCKVEKMGKGEEALSSLRKIGLSPLNWNRGGRGKMGSGEAHWADEENGKLTDAIVAIVCYCSWNSQSSHIFIQHLTPLYSYKAFKMCPFYRLRNWGSEKVFSRWHSQKHQSQDFWSWSLAEVLPPKFSLPWQWPSNLHECEKMLRSFKKKKKVQNSTPTLSEWGLGKVTGLEPLQLPDLQNKEADPHFL